MNKNFYDILEVRTDASSEVIKAAYKTLAQKYHPDKNSSLESEELMKLINKSYSVLSNAQDRKSYDLYINQQIIKQNSLREEQVRHDEQKKLELKEKLLKKQYEDLLSLKNKENEYLKNKTLIKQQPIQSQQAHSTPLYDVNRLFEQYASNQQYNDQIYNQNLLHRRKINKIKFCFGLVVYGSTLFIMSDFLFGFTNFNYNTYINEKLNHMKNTLKNSTIQKTQ